MDFVFSDIYLYNAKLIFCTFMIMMVFRIITAFILVVKELKKDANK